jgi:hypothetical protein
MALLSTAKGFTTRIKRTGSMKNALDKHYPASEHRTIITRKISAGSALRSGTDAVVGYHHTKTL